MSKDISQGSRVLGSGQSLALPRGFAWVIEARRDYEAMLERRLQLSQERRARGSDMTPAEDGKKEEAVEEKPIAPAS